MMKYVRKGKYLAMKIMFEELNEDNLEETYALCSTKVLSECEIFNDI